MRTSKQDTGFSAICTSDADSITVRGRDLCEDLIERWRIHYNTIRPHSSLGYQPPAPQSILPRPARLPYATLQAAQQGDLNRRNSNLTGGPP